MALTFIIIFLSLQLSESKGEDLFILNDLMILIVNTNNYNYNYVFQMGVVIVVVIGTSVTVPYKCVSSFRVFVVDINWRLYQRSWAVPYVQKLKRWKLACF